MRQSKAFSKGGQGGSLKGKAVSKGRQSQGEGSLKGKAG